MNNIVTKKGNQFTTLGAKSIRVLGFYLHFHLFNSKKGIDEMKSSNFRVNLSTVQTNILMMYLDISKIRAREVQHRLASVLETDPVKVSVKASSRDAGFVRFVTYWEITDEDVKAAIKKIQFVIKEFDEKLKN